VGKLAAVGSRGSGWAVRDHVRGAWHGGHDDVDNSSNIEGLLRQLGSHYLIGVSFKEPAEHAKGLDSNVR
jgi:hypothetical protein